MDACSACFEQRTIFTQQVLAKALNQLVGLIPISEYQMPYDMMS
jgi:symplekin